MRPTSVNQPDAATIDGLARAAFAELPKAFREHLGDVAIRVVDFADHETLRAVGLNNRWELTGLYEGRPLSEASSWTSGDLPPLITLYRMPLLREWRANGGKLEDLIQHVVVHEVGHHFGLSDADMEALEFDAPG